MKPSPSLVRRMARRYQRLQKRRNAELPNKADVAHVYSHAAFADMIDVAGSVFPEADFRWLMRFDDFNFMHDVLGMFACLDPVTAEVKNHFEPRFVSRSLHEAARAGKKGGVK